MSIIICKRKISTDAKGRNTFRCSCEYRITEGNGVSDIKRGGEVLCPSCSTYWHIEKESGNLIAVDREKV